MDNEEKQKEQDNSNEFIQEAMSKFMEKFAPAVEYAYTNLYTTEEITNALKGLNPGANVSPQAIYNIMKEYGFDYMPASNQFSLSMKWMVKQK